MATSPKAPSGGGGRSSGRGRSGRIRSGWPAEISMSALHDVDECAQARGVGVLLGEPLADALHDGCVVAGPAQKILDFLFRIVVGKGKRQRLNAVDLLYVLRSLGEEWDGACRRGLESPAGDEPQVVEERPIHHRAERASAHHRDDLIEAHGWQYF